MSSPRTLRDYTSIPFEVVIVVLTVLPFFLLAYFYSVLPDRVPLFMRWNGEVAQWGENKLKQQIKREFGDANPRSSVDQRHVYGGILYFNRSDSALFPHKYFFNFGNKWVWVFIACIIAYPVLVFWPK